MTKSIDYINTYFEFPELTKIHGRPTYENLKTIKNELTTNGSTVSSSLGGGRNGHTGLILTPQEFTMVSATPYVRPANPGVLVLPAGVGITNLNREIARDTHKENVRVFREDVDVEKALLKQLVQAVPEVYIKPFRNQYSNAIDLPISTVLTSLFTTYGDIQDEILQENTEKLRERIFNISDPLVVLFNEIQELKALSIAADNEYTEKQLVNIGVHLIKNMNDFERGLETWIVKPAADRTWVNFKAHFEDAHSTLRKVRGPLMRNTTFNNTANAISASVINSVREELNEDRSRVFQRLDETESSIITALHATPSISTTPSLEDETTISTLTEKVNATTSDNINLQILKLLKEISDDMKDSKQPRNKHPQPQHTRKRKRKRTDTSKYCWSCGAWNHTSSTCRFKKTGHQDNATFKNKMNGSTAHCPDE